MNTNYASLYYIISSHMISFITFYIYDIFNSLIKHSCLRWKIRNYSNEIIIYIYILKTHNLKVISKNDFQITWSWIHFDFENSYLVMNSIFKIDVLYSDFHFQNHQVGWFCKSLPLEELNSNWIFSVWQHAEFINEKLTINRYFYAEVEYNKFLSNQ